MRYEYTYDIWGGVLSCTPVEDKKEAPKKKGSKKDAPANDSDTEQD